MHLVYIFQPVAEKNWHFAVELNKFKSQQRRLYDPDVMKKRWKKETQTTKTPSYIRRCPMNSNQMHLILFNRIHDCTKVGAVTWFAISVLYLINFQACMPFVVRFWKRKFLTKTSAFLHILFYFRKIFSIKNVNI